MPADTHALIPLPCRNTVSERVNHADYLVAGYPWVLQTRQETLLDHLITVADPTSLNSDSHPAGAGFRNVTLYDLKRSARVGNLYGTHFWHKQFRVRGEIRPLDAGIPRAVEAATRSYLRKTKCAKHKLQYRSPKHSERTRFARRDTAHLTRDGCAPRRRVRLRHSRATPLRKSGDKEAFLSVGDICDFRLIGCCSEHAATTGLGSTRVLECNWPASPPDNASGPGRNITAESGNNRLRALLALTAARMPSRALLEKAREHLLLKIEKSRRSLGQYHQ